MCEWAVTDIRDVNANYLGTCILTIVLVRCPYALAGSDDVVICVVSKHKRVIRAHCGKSCGWHTVNFRVSGWCSRTTMRPNPVPGAHNRHFGRLSALRAHTKAPYKLDFHGKTPRALNRPKCNSMTLVISDWPEDSEGGEGDDVSL